MMQTKFRNYLFLLSFSLLFMAGCSGAEKAPIFVGEVEPDAFTLSFQKPEVFEFNIPEKGSYQFDLEITYYSEQMQLMGNSLPLYYILEGPGLGDGVDKKFGVQVKNEAGEWRGDLLENEHDRKVQDAISSDVQLESGKHTLKLYADSQEQGQAVQGIVRVTFKVR